MKKVNKVNLLKHIGIPTSIVAISSCGSINNLSNNNSKNENVKIRHEDGVQKIGNYAFHYCENLKEITLPLL